MSDQALVMGPSWDLTYDLILSKSIQYDSAEWEPAFLRQAGEFLFFPLLRREASKRVPIFDRGTGSKPERNWCLLVLIQ